MEPARWQQICDLYEEALDLNPSDRTALLASRCHGDEQLRAEVESLLSIGSKRGILDSELRAGLPSPHSIAFAAGTRLGPYEIVAPLGAGGMGVVYRARDPRLKREVALKVLPAIFASDPERMARFQREAEILASLNHPNVAQIYGVEDRALVMELVEGNTLTCPLPLMTALGYARQIAEALEYAHEKGVVHRDLKPANIKVTPGGTVKVLDFGLAKAAETPVVSSDPSLSPTASLTATGSGMIMGTASYMSPEQAAGKAVDKRSDIWSFGVVMWEMLTGDRLFYGESMSHTLAEVLRAEIEFNQLSPEIPVLLRELLVRCLDRDTRTRLRDIGEARIVIQKCLADHGSGVPASYRLRQETGLTVQPPAWRGRLSWTIAGISMAVLAISLWTFWPRARDLPLVRIDADLGRNVALDDLTVAAISPDGGRLVFPVRLPDGNHQLATRLLNQPQTRVLAGTDGGTDPFYSPDGKWIGFFTPNKLKKIPSEGGTVIALCDTMAEDRGASWSEGGYIIAALDPGAGLSRIAEDGGKPQPVTQLQRGEVTHRWPQFLPGGQALLFTSHSASDYDNANIELLTLASGNRKVLVRGGYFGRYMPASRSAGFLLYIRQGTLYGVRFDLGRFEIHGSPVALLDDVAIEPGFAAGRFDFAPNGIFVYLSGKGNLHTWPIDWLDGSGRLQPLLPRAAEYYGPQFSPDGRVLAFNIQGKDLFAYDHQRDVMTRLTFSGQENKQPVWTPDGKHLVYGTESSPTETQLLWIRADGTGEPQVLLGHGSQQFWPHSFAPDGRRLAYAQRAPQNGWDLWTITLDSSDPEHPKAGQPELFLGTPFNERFPSFSPDGRWIAYQSDESGKPQVYVRPFPPTSRGEGKWQVSTDGGQFPIWSPKGESLYYETLDNRIMVADYMAAAGSFVLRKPRLWSGVALRNATILDQNLALTPDGKRFAVFPPPASVESNGSAHIVFLLNFADELRRRIPEM